MIQKTWSDDDIDHLTERYGTDTAADIAHHLGRSVKSVRRKADNLGLATPSTWSRADTRQLRRLSQTMSVGDIARFTGRTPASVREKLTRLNPPADTRTLERRPWVTWELQAVDDAAGHDSVRDVAQATGRSVTAVLSMMKKRGVTPNREPWGDDEIEFVRHNRDSLDVDAVATILSRTDTDVQKMIEHTENMEATK